MSQTDLGEKVNRAKEVISSYERGVTVPPLEVIIDLSKNFQISIDDLVFRNIEEEGISEKRSSEMTIDQNILEINRLMSLRINELEREIRRHYPDLADDLGIN